MCSNSLAHFHIGGKYPAPYQSQQQSYFCPPHTAGPWPHHLLCCSLLPYLSGWQHALSHCSGGAIPSTEAQRTTNQVPSSSANFGSWGTLFFLLVPMRHVWQGVPSSRVPHCLCSSSFYGLSIFFVNCLGSIFLLNLL